MRSRLGWVSLDANELKGEKATREIGREGRELSVVRRRKGFLKLYSIHPDMKRSVITHESLYEMLRAL